MKRAIISLSDKSGLAELAKELINLNYEIISTGGTLQYLSDHNIKATAVSDITDFPEIMNGRVKTLHPKIMGGILGIPTNDLHKKQAESHNITFIDLVIVNLYPFEKTINNPMSTWFDTIENIDIGGPSLIRAAAKNYHFVSIVTDPNDYQLIINELKNNNEVNIEIRKYLSHKAFALTASYDSLIAQTLNMHLKESSKKTLNIGLQLKDDLRYGENPHQSAGFYESEYDNLIDVIHGKQLSYNNYLDIDSALKLIMKFSQKTCAILKHTNACGVASSDNLTDAYRKAFTTDTISPFGGIVIVNDELSLETSKAINEVFTEIIIAPSITPEALEFLKKKKDRRIIIYQKDELNKLITHPSVVSCLNGYLSQSPDIILEKKEDWKYITKSIPNENEILSLEFAWNVVSMLKSNAICIAKGTQTIGVGIGQTSRVDSLRIAINRAIDMGFDLNNSVCASDGFFPKIDSLELLKSYGIHTIIQPGGSKADDEVIDYCNENNLSMIFTGSRHFRH